MAAIKHARTVALQATSPRVVAVALPTNVAVNTGNITNGAVTGPKVGTGAVDTANLAAAAVTGAKIADLAITTAKIDDAQITNAKIGALAVDTAKINGAAITTAKIADAAITNAKIGLLAVDTAQIATAAITNAKIGALAVDAAKIADATITTGKIADAQITSAKIASATITTANIADAQITSAKIASATITDANIASLSASKITAGTISASKINGGTYTGASIQIAAASLGWLLDVGTGGTTVYYRMLEGYNILAGNGANPGDSAVEGASGTAAAGVYGNSSHAGGHGVRGEAGSGLGFVGYSGGAYDFYAYGAATNYGPFTGAHDALVLKGAPLEIGDIVCDLGVAARKNVSNTICAVSLSSAPGQGAAVGVVCTLPRSIDIASELPAALMTRVWSYPPDARPIETPLPCLEWETLRWTHDAITINALGEGQVNVCGAGGDLLPGDLITTSATPGKGMRQIDDIVRASSVAKCREAVTFDAPGQIKQVACIYLCG